MHIGKFLILGVWTLRRVVFSNWADRGEVVRSLHVEMAGGDNESLAKANVISSEQYDQNREVIAHRPVLDLDMECVLFESTGGNSHLLINKDLSTEQYDKLLQVLVEVGLYNKGCYAAWKARGFTAVRVPWCLKSPSDPHSQGGPAETSSV